MKLPYLHPVAIFPSSGALRKFWMMGVIAVIVSESTCLMLQSLIPFNYEVCSFLGNTYEMTP